MTSANASYTVSFNKNARAVLMAFLLNKLELAIVARTAQLAGYS